MKNSILIFSCFFLLFHAALAQKKVWNDDKEAILKADTSQVTIDGRDYRKFITVSYEEIDQKQLKEDFKRRKQELKWVMEQRADLDERIDDLQAEMRQVKSLYSETAKKKKWKDTEVDTPDVSDPEIDRREKLKADFLANPRRPK